MRLFLFHYVSIVILVFLNVRCICGTGRFYNANGTSNKYYIEFEGKLNWFESQLACLDLNMTLAEPDSSEKAREIESLLETAAKPNENDRYYTWIGGILQGDFVWLTTGKTFNYTNWYGNNPDFWKDMEYCAELTGPQNWKWNDDDCFEKRGFVCEYIKTEPRILEDNLNQEIENHLNLKQNLEGEREKQKKDILDILQQLNNLKYKNQQQLLYSFLEERKLQVERNMDFEKTHQKENEKQLELQQNQKEKIEQLKEKLQQLQAELKNETEKHLNLQKEKQQSFEDCENKKHELEKQLEVEIKLKNNLQKELDIKSEQIQRFKNQQTELENNLVLANNKLQTFQRDQELFKQQALKQSQLEVTSEYENDLKIKLQKAYQNFIVENKKLVNILEERQKNLEINLREQILVNKKTIQELQQFKEENLEMENKLKTQKVDELQFPNKQKLEDILNQESAFEMDLLKKTDSKTPIEIDMSVNQNPQQEKQKTSEKLKEKWLKTSFQTDLLGKADKFSNNTEEDTNIFLVYSPYRFYFQNN